MLNAKVTETEEQVLQTQNVLENKKQALLAVLRSSISKKLDYWLTLWYSSHVEHAASSMDNLRCIICAISQHTILMIFGMSLSYGIKFTFFKFGAFSPSVTQDIAR